MADKPELRGAAPVKPQKPQPPHVDADDVNNDSKTACGESQPESVGFDFGAGDLADIVLVEDEGAEE